MGEEVDARRPGGEILRADLLATAALVVTSVAAAVSPDTFGIVHAALSCVLFAIGLGALLWAYALGVSRSRTDLITVAGLFFLTDGVAPPEVRRPFWWALGAQVLVVVAAASVRPYTNVAFGVLAPTLGLGLMAVWGGRHGEFPPRPPKAPA